MKYTMVSTSVFLQGKLFKKSDKPALDDTKLNKVELDAAYRQGFIKPVGTKATTPTEVVEQYLSETETKVSDKDKDELKKRQESDERKAKVIENAEAEIAKYKQEKDKAEAIILEEKDKLSSAIKEKDEAIAGKVEAEKKLADAQKQITAFGDQIESQAKKLIKANQEIEKLKPASETKS